MEKNKGTIFKKKNGTTSCVACETMEILPFFFIL